MRTFVLQVQEITPMTRAEYNELRGWELPANEDGNDTGFHLVYPNGHQNWFPEKQFNELYQEAENPQSHPSAATSETNANRGLTFGQKAVGINFNPGGDPEVNKAKQIMADAIDQMNDLRNESNSPEARRHAAIAITELESAQMRMVKAITWKD